MGQALGYVRHAAVAWLMGTSAEADALAVAVVPVELLWHVSFTACVFGFGPALARGHASAGSPYLAAARRSLIRVAVVTTAALFGLAPAVAWIVAPGLLPEARGEAEKLLRLTALAAPALLGCAFCSAVLYSRRSFWLPALFPAVTHLCTILTGVLLYGRAGAASFAAGYVVGAWLQFAALAWKLVRQTTCEPAPAADHAAGAPWKDALPVLLYSALIGLNMMAARAFVSGFGSGAVAGFDYSLRILGVPLALLVVPISSSVMSEIARSRSGIGRLTAVRIIAKSAAIATALSAVAIVAVAGFGHQIVSLLFARGEFGPASAVTVTAILSGVFPALAGWSVLDILARAYFSLGTGRMPLVAAGGCTLVNLLLSSAWPAATAGDAARGAVLGCLTGAAILLFGLRKLGATDAASTAA